MRLSDNRYEAIKQIVVRLFEDYNVCSTPISGFEIANRSGYQCDPVLSISSLKAQSVHAA